MLTFNGKKFDSKSFERDLMESVTTLAKEEVAAQFRSIRDPISGEFPTVVIYGDEITDMSLKVEGSKQLLKHIRKTIEDDDLQGIQLVEREKIMSPKVFLSFGWEDKELAEKIAKNLLNSGIDTWWAEWEISAGDSLRQRIDEGLGTCTHFLVLLSPTAIVKSWVKQEMDAGLVRMLEKKCKFIPIRFNLLPSDLPPLLSGHYSPEITDSLNLSQLVNDIYGISMKPPIGKAPLNNDLPDTGYSMAASILAKVFCEKSETGTGHDPTIMLDELVIEASLTEDDVEDALFELRAFFSLKFGRVTPNNELFVEFDSSFMDWEPEQDALRIAAAMFNDDNFPTGVEQISSHFDWAPRRINPAVNFLVSRSICADDRTMGVHPWTQSWIREKQDGSIRRFVKSRS